MKPLLVLVALVVAACGPRPAATPALAEQPGSPPEVRTVSMPNNVTCYISTASGDISCIQFVGP